ncbi:hypothetical protein EGR_00265 [Echinococcus granulosus]|uniref:Uncharacterized protein n=1 Tax=Echinococcus granulosus TaxID=6210 RepID=W6UWJ1_ECHGR|nr:hypothetical protein EGR_00265 [Echinococcus granulosus]EUB64996.1 hypothetical protein EGR_00265 [Echinococcus granulosus]
MCCTFIAQYLCFDGKYQSFRNNKWYLFKIDRNAEKVENCGLNQGDDKKSPRNSRNHTGKSSLSILSGSLTLQLHCFSVPVCIPLAKQFVKYRPILEIKSEAFYNASKNISMIKTK